MSTDIRKLNERNIRKLSTDELLKLLKSDHVSLEYKQLCEAEWQRRNGVRQAIQAALKHL